MAEPIANPANHVSGKSKIANVWRIAGLVSRWGLLALMVLFFAYLIFLVRPRNVEEVPDGFTIVEYWEKWNEDEAIQMKIIVDDFNKSPRAQEKKIFVRFMGITGIDGKTRVSTAAGAPPDIAGIWDPQVAQFAAVDGLEPLDDLMKEFGIAPEHYKSCYIKACQYKGKTYALPLTPATIALHWNKRTFLENADKLRAAGCDPTRAPQTIEELDRYAAALDDWENLPNGTRRLRRAGFLPTEPGWYLSMIQLWFGGKIFDPATNEITVTDPRNKQAIEWACGYSRRIGVGYAVNFQNGVGDFRSERNPFCTGEVAMILQGPWMANYLGMYKPSMNQWKFSKEQEKTMSPEQRKDNYEWGVVPFPSTIPGAKNVGFAPEDILCIPKGAKHKREAFEFLAYTSQQEVMEKLCMMHCKNSPLAKVSDNYLKNHPNPYIDVFDAIAESPYAEAAPPCPIWPDLNAAWKTEIIDVMYRDPDGDKDKLLQEFQQRYAAKWKKYLDRQQVRATAEAKQ